MHLFFFHLYTDIDTLTPLIRMVGNKKTIITNINILNNHSNQTLIKFLKSNNYVFKNYKFLNIKSILIFNLIKIIELFPIYFLNKINFIFNYIYLKFDPISKKKLIIFLKKNKVKTITIDDGLPEKIQKKIIEISNKMNIKLITYRIGFDLLNTDKELIYKTKQIISSSTFEETKKRYNYNKYKFYNFNYLRYTSQWIEELKVINKKYSSSLPISNKHAKLKVLIFTRPRKNLFDENNSLIKRIKNNKNFQTIIKLKPRRIELKKQNYNTNNFDSSSLIDWADVVLSHSSSIIVEVLLKNKPVIFPYYLKIAGEKYLIKKFGCVNFMNSENEILDILNDISSNRQNISKYIFETNNYLLKSIGYYKSWKISKNQYNSLYKFE